MQKIAEFNAEDLKFSVYTDGVSKNEIYADGIYEILDLTDTIKLKFFTNTGISDGDRVIGEDKITVVLPRKAMPEIIDLLNRSVAGQTNQRSHELTTEKNRDDNFEILGQL